MGLSYKQIEKRDIEICRLRFKEKWKLKDLAIKYKLTKSRIDQILKEKGNYGTNS